ncbi:MAG: aspartate kinase [Bacteroidales bacterium]|nr:aspartate kinase [Bacteroidales bacterium]
MTISQAVEKVIKVKPFVMESLAEGLINISSLARRIHPTLEKIVGHEVKQGAIVMALNRLVPELVGSKVENYNDLLSMLGDIIVRSNLTDYTFRNTLTIFKSHVNLMNALNDYHDVFFTMVRGVFESNLIVGSSICQIVERMFAHEDCTYKQDNLSAITLKLPKKNVQAVGFYYQLLKFIAWEGINVKEVVSTTNEFSIIVSEDDVDHAFTILKNLKNSANLRY